LTAEVGGLAMRRRWDKGRRETGNLFQRHELCVIVRV
jgi:hypothetical protein